MSDYIDEQNICERMREMIREPEIRGVLSLVAAGSAVSAPYLSAIAGVLKESSTIVDEIKVKCFIKALTKDGYSDDMIERLSDYISRDEESAYIVANSLRKALLCESPISCALLGVILAKHIEDGHPYSRSDVIIINALEEIIDGDFKTFYYTVENYLEKDGYTLKIPLSVLEEREFFECIELFVQKRICEVKRGSYWEEMGTKQFDISYSLTTSGVQLMGYGEYVRELLEHT